MLSVKDLSFSFQHRPLFRDLSFRLQPKQILELKGANGAGKSTLLSIIAGLRKASSGTVVFDQEKARDLAYLSADANGLYYSLGALDNLTFWLTLKGHHYPKKKLEESLAAWGLAQKGVKEGLSVEHFSTGMKRRLALLRMSLSGSLLWLLDEPSFGLDASGLKLFNCALTEHLKAGGAAIMVSHEPGFFSSYPDHPCLEL